MNVVVQLKNAVSFSSTYTNNSQASWSQKDGSCCWKKDLPSSVVHVFTELPPYNSSRYNETLVSWSVFENYVPRHSQAKELILTTIAPPRTSDIPDNQDHNCHHRRHHHTTTLSFIYSDPWRSAWPVSDLQLMTTCNALLFLTKDT
jgi:hypothetical protein